MPSDRISHRALTPDDQDFLWHMLHVALWDPPPAPLRPIEILQVPEVRLYAEAWGRAGDVGVVAMDGELAVGACWMRLMPEGQGLGWVDAATPQLGIALEPGHQGRGLGGPMMQAALEAARRVGHAQVALTVHPANPAISLYLRMGFTDLGERRGGYRLMLAQLV